jgi:hypothetical protein
LFSPMSHNSCRRRTTRFKPCHLAARWSALSVRLVAWPMNSASRMASGCA